MDNMWKYKIEIGDLHVFDEIVQERGIKIPDELKKFIINKNASTPSKYNFMLNTLEKVFGAVLSFNRNETGTDTIFFALKTIENKQLIPFGIDPFGNYICYSLSDGNVVFWDHETETIISTEKNLHDFIETLY